MTKLKDVLQSEEQIIQNFTGIKYCAKEYNCTVTNLRTLLYRNGEDTIITIDHKGINSISLEKEWYIDIFYLIPISFSLAFICLTLGLFTYFPLNFTPANIVLLRAFLYPGIAFLVIGIIASYVYITYIHFSALLVESTKLVQLFSNRATILEFIRILKHAQTGAAEALNLKKPLEFTRHQIIISKIFVGISAIACVIIVWVGYIFQELLYSLSLEWLVTILRDLLYIPFLLLTIGFIIGVLAFNENKVKVIRFKLGFLLAYIGIIFIGAFIYFDILTTPPLVIFLLGVGLFLYC